MRGYKNPGHKGYKPDRIKKQVKSLIMSKPAPMIIPGKKGGASQSSAVSSGVSANGTMGNIPGMVDSGNISGTGGFSSDNSTVSQAQNSAYDADNGDDASSMDRPGTDVKTVKKMDPAMSGTREPTKKPISRETRMAANKAAVSNMLRAKAEIERGIGSDKSTGDALNDGNSGVVRVITEMLNPMSHIKSVVYTLASLMLPHLITMFLTLTFIVVLITVVISAIMNAAGL